MMLNKANAITDHAYDRLKIIFKSDNRVFEMAHKAGSLRILCQCNDIDPDRETA